MKNSNIPWLGEVPDDWEIKRIKNIAKVCNNKNENLNLKYIGLENIESWTGKYIESESSYDISQALICNENNIIFGKLRPYLAKTYFVPNMMLCSSEFAVFEYNKCPRFLYYILQSHFFINIVDSSTYGTKMPRANIDFIGNINIALPPLSTQKAIADFLDKKCAEIDVTIEKTKTTIEKYKKLKQSIITEAVTKGLKQDVPMRDSGIEWIGEIPEGWEIIRLKFLCNVITGTKDTVDRDDDGDYPFYVRSPKVEKINSVGFEGEAILMAGDGVGAGKVFHYANGKFDFHQRVYNLHNFNKISAKFLHFYLSNNFWKEIEKGNAKSTVDSIRLPMIQNFPTCIPPLEEQQEIVDFLDKKTAIIDDIITKKEALLEKLTGYKKSLIYEAVTGKMEG